MAPTTRSAAVRGNSGVIEKQSTRIVKKKPQPRKTKVQNDMVEKEVSIENNVNDPNLEPVKNVAKRKQQSEDTRVKKTKLENYRNEEAESSREVKCIYEFKVKDIDGNEVSLDKYKGHVCIIVNVASRCGHTKSNYEQLVELYEKYAKSNNLRILAFPCNQFGSQESGTCEKIKAFAEKKGVKFDMFDKINVNGKNASPLWIFLKDKLPEVTSGKTTGKDIKWNFTKFIVNKEGIPVERYASSTKPLTLVESLQKLW